MDLQTFFKKNNNAAIAFSGGTDSSYLLWAALQNDANVTAYYVKSAFQPQFELNDAVRMTKELGVKMKILNVDILADSKIVSNPCNRCYYCKKVIFGLIEKTAHNDGFTLLIDGTNASDDESDRPGMRALAEMSVRSPLRECKLTKKDVRRLSKDAGLFTWNKPAYACLATRIPTGEKITEDKLISTEQSELFLSSLGFSDFRIRTCGNTAKIQIPESQFDLLLRNRKTILVELKKHYENITLDLEVRS